MQPSSSSTGAPPPLSGYASLKEAFPATSVRVSCPNSAASAMRLKVGDRLAAHFAAPVAVSGMQTTARIVAVSDAPTPATSGKIRVTSRGHAVYTVSVDCGVTLGLANMTCSIDAGVSSLLVEMTCPSLQWTPSCGYWNTAAQRWAHDGCKLAAVSASGFYCSCSHLTAFAGRFRAVAADQRDVRIILIVLLYM